MIKMKKGNRIAEIKDDSLVGTYEKEGWEKVPGYKLEAKAEVKPPKKEFTDVKNVSEQVDVTPTDKKASFNETSNKGEK